MALSRSVAYTISQVMECITLDSEKEKKKKGRNPLVALLINSVSLFIFILGLGCCTSTAVVRSSEFSSV